MYSGDCRIYACDVCNGFHPWNWDGDCRDDANRFDSPENFANSIGIDPLDVVEMLMDDHLLADGE